MKILFIGDIVARLGRRAVGEVLPPIVAEKKIDLVIANIENLAGGKGATKETIDEIRSYGVDICTSGNHIWARDEIIELLDSDPTLLRPANYPPETPGFGFTYAQVGKEKVLVINLLGKEFIPEPLDDPFRVVDAILTDQVDKEKPQAIILDFHGEATSEKGAMAWYLDGKVTAVLGTHTHIATADTRILPKGTAFVTDVGMVGPLDSILGVEPDLVIKKLKSPMPVRFEWVETGEAVFNSVMVETTKDGLAKKLERVDKIVL